MSGQSDRRLDERVRKLVGDAASPDRAVLLGELEDRVLAIIQDAAERAVNILDDSNQDNAGFLSNFRNPGRTAGPYSWQLASIYDRPNTLFPPPAGLGGGAVFLERALGIGTWLASISDGPIGSHEMRLFGMSTSGQADDFGVWREFFTEQNAVGSIGFGADGKPTGGLFHTISNSNGVVTRLANGYQLCFKLNLTITQASAGNMTAVWTFPAEFTAPPFAIGVLPTSTHGVYTNVSTLDFSSLGVDPDLTDVLLSFRRDTSATSFPADATVTNVSGFAFGKFQP